MVCGVVDDQAAESLGIEVAASPLFEPGNAADAQVAVQSIATSGVRVILLITLELTMAVVAAAEAAGTTNQPRRLRGTPHSCAPVDVCQA